MKKVLLLTVILLFSANVFANPVTFSFGSIFILLLIFLPIFYIEAYVIKRFLVLFNLEDLDRFPIIWVRVTFVTWIFLFIAIDKYKYHPAGVEIVIILLEAFILKYIVDSETFQNEESFFISLPKALFTSLVANLASLLTPVIAIFIIGGMAKILE